MDSEATDAGRAPDLSLAVPCFNEEEVLRKTSLDLLQTFEQHGHRLELVLVDNGSTDRTSAIIDELIAEGRPVVKGVVAVNEGQGLGFLTGLALCRARWVGIIPADGQVLADDVVRLFELALGAERPAVFKVRRRQRRDGLERALASLVGNSLGNLLFGGLGTMDVNGSPKIFLRADCERMRLASRDWFLEAEIVIRAKQLGIPVRDMDVVGQEREGGTSKVRATTMGEFLANALRARFGRIGPGRERDAEPAPHSPSVDRGRPPLT